MACRCNEQADAEDHRALVELNRARANSGRNSPRTRLSTEEPSQRECTLTRPFAL